MNLRNGLFAVSVVASRNIHSTISVRHTAFMVRAYNLFEANGKAIAIAQKIYPFVNGFHGHHVVVVPDNTIEELDTVTSFE